MVLPKNLVRFHGINFEYKLFKIYSVLHIVLILFLLGILINRADASIVSLNNYSKSFESDYLGQSCQNNYHCNVSSWCCSEYKCVPGIICQNGQKEINDVCDYQFECFSRCCNKNTNKCSPFMDCVQECKSNKDCTSGCCSINYCSATTTCNSGRKVENDYCDVSSECKSMLCIKNKCATQE